MAYRLTYQIIITLSSAPPSAPWIRIPLVPLILGGDVERAPPYPKAAAKVNVITDTIQSDGLFISFKSIIRECKSDIHATSLHR